MPLNIGGPLEAFGVGQSIGQANSPVTGIGIAIRNIVEDARKKGLLQAEQSFKTQGAIQAAEATQPLELSKLKYGSELDTQRAIDVAEGTAPIETQKAINIEAGTQPYKQENIITQAAEQGAQSRLTDEAKINLQTKMKGTIGQQPTPEVFKDVKTGKTMIRNWTYDDNTGQWIAKISPASFNLMEQVMGGATPTGGSSVDNMLDTILKDFYTQE